MKMLTNHIAVLRDPAKETSEGGLIFSRKEDQWTGTVKFAGPGRVNDQGVLIPMPVQPGQRVLFKRHGTDTFEHEGVKYDLMIADESDHNNKVLAIIEE